MHFSSRAKVAERGIPLLFAPLTFFAFSLFHSRQTRSCEYCASRGLESSLFFAFVSPFYLFCREKRGGKFRVLRMRKRITVEGFFFHVSLQQWNALRESWIVFFWCKLECTFIGFPRFSNIRCFLDINIVSPRKSRAFLQLGEWIATRSYACQRSCLEPWECLIVFTMCQINEFMGLFCSLRRFCWLRRR